MDGSFVKIAVGDPARLQEYCDVFLDSPLYTHYFADSDLLVTWLGGALAKKELLVATTEQDEVVGVMEVRPYGFFGSFPYLALLGVKKSWRGMGIGHQMIKVFEEMARQLGCNKASLMVSHFNPRAKNLYQVLGYKKIGYLENAFKEGNHENIMVKNL